MMKFKGADILSTKQFTRQDLGRVFRVAKSMEPFAFGKKKSQLLDGKILSTLFFEASTRTRLSFETAMLRLGGGLISTADAVKFSSVTKGETLPDTGRIVGGYADVIAMRHPVQGSVAELASGTDTPVINAGDGPGQHPTQALLDLYTIEKEFGKIDGLTIALVGDLKYGRTVHSLADLASHYQVNFVFVSPIELMMPSDITQELKQKGFQIRETHKLDAYIGDLDVLYDTRIQKERFEDHTLYEKLKNVYQIDKKLMRKAKKKMIVMHPLPRVDEILTEVDADPRARYFEQALNGVPVRMALLALVLGKTN